MARRRAGPLLCCLAGVGERPSPRQCGFKTPKSQPGMGWQVGSPGQKQGSWGVLGSEGEARKGRES